MIFRRLVSPLAMVTDERGILKISAKNSTTARLALPSTGGAVRASFSASPTAPVMAFLRARGCTFTLKLTPAAASRIGIMLWEKGGRQKWLPQRARRLILPQWLLQNHATYPWTARPSGC